MAWAVIQADARRIPLADVSVHCVVTSPPYWGLRDYGVAGQIGLEPTPEAFVAGMVQVFREVRRVLRDDGTCWMNLGDSYAGSWGAQSRGDHYPGTLEGSSELYGISARQIKAAPKETNTGSLKHTPGLKNKDLIGIPWRVALALQADGWYLRSDVIWSKPNPMPESVTDRPTKAHEYIFLLAKAERYYYDADAIRDPHVAADRNPGNKSRVYVNRDPMHASTHKMRPANDASFHPGGRNKRTVWEIATQSYSEAHFATYPEKLVEPCILAGTSERGCCASCGAPWERVIEKTRTFESGSGQSGNAPVGKYGPGLQGGGETGDVRREPCVHSKTIGWQPGCTCGAAAVPCVVFDPFNGSGTTGAVARRHGRRYVGLELNREYIGMAVDRISRAERPSTARSTRKAADAPLFEGVG